LEDDKISDELNSVVVTVSGVVPLKNFNLTTGLSGIHVHPSLFGGGESDFRNTPPDFSPTKKNTCKHATKPGI